MRSVAILSALAVAGTNVVSAASTTSMSGGGTTCSKDIVITQPTPTMDCDVVDADITVDENLSGSLSIEGPKQLLKGLIAKNATKLIGISSSSINYVSNLDLEGLQLLSTFSMTALTSVDSLKFMNLPQLGGFMLGSQGFTEAKSIVIADTFISSLDGLKITKADTIDCSNNPKLSSFNSPLESVNKLRLTNNGNNMRVNLSRLETAGDVQFRQVKSFDAPALYKVGSLKFNDSPELESVSANNLTEVKSSVTFINNKKLNDISFQRCTKIDGDMTIQNNTELKNIEPSFPSLESCGTILLRGSFEKIGMQNLTDVKGSARAISTTDISAFCGYFDDLKKKGTIRGKEECTSNVKNANEGGNTGQNGEKKEDAAGIVSVNMAMLGLAAFAAFAHML